MKLNKLLEQQIVTTLGNENIPERYQSLFKIISDSYDEHERIAKTGEGKVEEENIYRALFEKMADGVYKSSHEGKFIEVNPALVKMLGYSSKEELMAIDIKSKLYFETSERDNAVMQDIKEGISIFRLRKKDGSEIWVEDRGQYVNDENGKVLYHEGILRDVTKRILTELELAQSNTELRKSNHELDKFVYSVSHDLRAPLLSMQGVVDITEEETEEELTSAHMKMLRGSINKLDNFIGEILAYSRNARSEIKCDVIDCKKLLEELTCDLQYMNGANKTIAIEVNVQGEGNVCTDKGRLSVVLNNLVSNSIRYHNPEAAKPYVKIDVDTDESEARIIVEDNGIGISEEYHQKVFEMFYRVSENSNGSGLGLYIVKETVDKLKGSISVESKPGVGTKFILSIPNLFYQ